MLKILPVSKVDFVPLWGHIEFCVSDHNLEHEKS